MFKAGDTIKMNSEVVLGKDISGPSFTIGGVLFTESQLIALGAVKVKAFNNESYIQNEFNNLNLERQLLIMNRALDEMQSNQHLTKWMAIYIAMGYNNDEGKQDTWYKVGGE
jgi:hypothetical protein